jgi:RHS repeat-associated protein
VQYNESYLPYGERRVNNPASAVAQASGNRLWFHGKAQDEATGLQYFGARYYDPALGRFMGVDPEGFEEKNLHSFNRFAYGNNNPYRYSDPDGRQAHPLSELALRKGQEALSREGAFRAARMDAKIPSSAIPKIEYDKLYDGTKAVNQTPVYNNDGTPVLTRIYVYEVEGKTIKITEHSAGHLMKDKDSSKWVVEQKGHFNVVDKDGKTLPGAKDHYDFKNKTNAATYFWRSGGQLVPRKED